MASSSSKRWGTILVAGFAITVLALGLILNFSKENTGIIDNQRYSDRSSPFKYCVAESYRGYSHNTTHTFIGSFVSFIEGTYNFFGIQTSSLTDNQYINFSTKALELCLEKYCSTKNCSSENFNSSSIREVFNGSYPQPNEMALPAAACEDKDCMNYQNLVNNNPVNFDITRVRYTRYLNEIKQMLFDTERPILLTLNEPLTEFTLPCNHKLVQNTNTCLAGGNKCPETINYSGCDTILYRLEQMNSMSIPDYAGKIKFGQPETYLILGWNDDFVFPTLSRERNQTRGGIVYTHSRGNDGASIGYLHGDSSFQKNFEFCPQPDNYIQWNRSDISCLQKTNNISRCGTVLNCTDANFCDPQSSYSLLSLDGFNPITNTDSFGIKYVAFINENLTKIIQVPEFKIVDAFEPSLKPNPKRECSFWIMSYRVFEELEKANIQPYATSLSIKWAMCSYPTSSSQQDYTNITRSLYSIK